MSIKMFDLIQMQGIGYNASPTEIQRSILTVLAFVPSTPQQPDWRLLSQIRY
jgi:hypothetical protein